MYLSSRSRLMIILACFRAILQAGRAWQSSVSVPLLQGVQGAPSGLSGNVPGGRPADFIAFRCTNFCSLSLSFLSTRNTFLPILIVHYTTSLTSTAFLPSFTPALQSAGSCGNFPIWMPRCPLRCWIAPCRWPKYIGGILFEDA